MDNNTFKDLLYEEESPSLDFKRDQYRFVGATDPEKSELLKDIIAFANAWRRSTAYILIGVEEIKGGRSKLSGVARQLDDAALQQFVNSKTNRPINFRYEAFSYGNNQFGIIEIPLQERPFFLTRNFGKLRKKVVYVRRGSSTAEADPTEIARMGAAAVREPLEDVDLEVEFANVEERSVHGRKLALESVHLSPRVNPDDLRPRRTRNRFGIDAVVTPQENPAFYDEFVDFVARTGLLRRVGLVVSNASGRTARSVNLRMEIEAITGLHVVDQDDEPSAPSRRIHPIFSSAIPQVGRPRPVPHVSRHGGRYEISVTWESILPRDLAWSDGYFLIGGEQDMVVPVSVHVYAEELPMPVEDTLEIEISSRQRAMELNELHQLLGRDEEEGDAET